MFINEFYMLFNTIGLFGGGAQKSDRLYFLGSHMAQNNKKNCVI